MFFDNISRILAEGWNGFRVGEKPDWTRISYIEYHPVCQLTDEQGKPYIERYCDCEPETDIFTWSVYGTFDEEAAYLLHDCDSEADAISLMGYCNLCVTSRRELLPGLEHLSVSKRPENNQPAKAPVTPALVQDFHMICCCCGEDDFSVIPGIPPFKHRDSAMEACRLVAEQGSSATRYAVFHIHRHGVRLVGSEFRGCVG
ncbi:hypothetical protein [Vibrio aerogenes]|uniref:hypothetical protein n=1 Tax=Vibrio aerogenes TaxID=92172 RepID=UPI0021C3210D|nr:hypothetical protein [Vibrio aerogenes]